MDKRIYNPGEIWQLPDDHQNLVTLITFDNPETTFTRLLIEGKVLFGEESLMDGFMAYQEYFHFLSKDGALEMMIRKQIYGDKGIAELKGVAECGEDQVLWAGLCNNIEGGELLRYFSAIDWEDLDMKVPCPLSEPEIERMEECRYQIARAAALAELEAKFPGRSRDVGQE